MAKQITEDVAKAVKELIMQVTSLKEDTEAFEAIQKRILDIIKKSDTMCFFSKQEVDKNIADMAAKFILHNFFPQANALQSAYKSYIPENLPQGELVSRLNTVKFLLYMSVRPTNKFEEDLQKECQTESMYKFEEDEQEIEINWGEYLKEGIETWMPADDETSEDSQSCSQDDFSETLVRDKSGFSTPHLPMITDGAEKVTIVDFRANREELLATIQHTWYNQDRFYMPPASNWTEANIGILWDNFLEEQAMGLIPIQKSSIISEYKVIREILWQMWSHHNSAVFELHINNMRPRSGVTISSIRAETFEKFLLNKFIPYMEVMEFFRDFSKSLMLENYESIDDIPCTYRSYNASLQNIIQPIYLKLCELEDKVREQETTYTLLKLASDLDELMKPIMLLKKIHNEVVIDINENSNCKCATVLLCKLHNSLRHSVTKLEQDLQLTLFLESLYRYFTLIDDWLIKNDLADTAREFIIINENKSWYRNERIVTSDQYESIPDCEKWTLNFHLRTDLEDICQTNGLMKIIGESVLQIGRNLHLLRSLGKFPILHDRRNETIHEEFIRRCLEELDKFFKACPPADPCSGDPTTLSPPSNSGETTGCLSINKEISSSAPCDCQFCCPGVLTSGDNKNNYKYPVVCTEDCKRPTEFDRLENLVDTTDGFLMLAFEDYFIEKPEEKKKEKVETLLERVSRITTTLFPTMDFFERIFNDILEDRFAKSKLMVKNVLIEEYFLRKQFQFLRHVFLFWDDLIFPFYNSIIQSANSSEKHPASIITLTWQLQDIIMDEYPEFYKKCTVQTNEYWLHSLDSLDMCSSVEVHFTVEWPLNIVVHSSQIEIYQDIFRFIIQLKWALYTTNRMAFTDLGPKKARRKDLPKAYRNVIMTLKCLRFSISNLLSSIQHYVFSFIFTKCLQTFELNFEKARDLSSIMMSHSQYVSEIYSMLSDISQPQNEFPSFENLIDCVKLLKMMWDDVELATPERLEHCHDIYKMCYKAIDPVICPIDICDFYLNP